MGGSGWVSVWVGRWEEKLRIRLNSAQKFYLSVGAELGNYPMSNNILNLIIRIAALDNLNNKQGHMGSEVKHFSI